MVYLEQIIHTDDCDTDDYLESRMFRKEDEPKDWKIEIWEKEEDDYMTAYERDKASGIALARATKEDP